MAGYTQNRYINRQLHSFTEYTDRFTDISGHTYTYTDKYKYIQNIKIEI